ncbi:quinol:cytochrome c oxidoreductase quinone-binding subunit 2 [Candidatus Koribacter versatilis Ellin345]|uniref:Quinol:cytochrome c oxidoreductase quinone-binding subunit 2 n=1 Tax=Koribacter versatilis (strain Ellin345) TaxID=204669 RepID=Q1IMA0_KORVE|nr:hypothetical protein [Candidatus Koribacter versatilis]ABF42000.1 quinol:cytochrome c oxidoreductase quinone-binding subunit 2 [Candidatus Koribacter versatilis Ellin345]
MSDTHVREFDYTVPAAAAGWQRNSVIIGVIGAIALAVIGVFWHQAFMRGYLVGFMLWLGLSLGCMALLMLQYVTGGLWGLVSRRFLEAAAKGFPLMAIIFIPFAIAAPSFYPWVDHQTWWLNFPWFYIRAAIYFVIWTALSYTVSGWGRRYDEGPAPSLSGKLQAISAPGLILYVFTITFAAVDWVMSLTHGWVSTIYGLLYLAGQGLSALAFVIIMLWLVSKYEPYRTIVTRTQVHDIGKLMMAFTLLWAYFSYSQFLITWSANLPEEIQWYLHRIRGAWAPVAIFIVMFHFFVPFGIMLSQEFKRSLNRLWMLAVFMIFMRVVDLFWYIAPNFDAPHPEQAGAFPELQVLLAVAASVIGIGGLWLAFFFFNLRKAPLAPAYDPQMPLLLSMSEHGH